MSFRFNDELLLKDEDLKLAEQSYPDIFFAMNHPELREEFKRVDALAVKAKNKSRWIGCAALIFATLSLLTFPSEPMAQRVLSTVADPGEVVRILAILGASFGLLALVFGNIGLGFGRVKRNWLQTRLITERLRQWHAQYLVAHAVEIAKAAGSQERINTFEDKRSLEFKRFKRTFIDQIGSEYTKFTNVSAAAYSGQSIIDPEETNAFWIDPNWAKEANVKPGDSDQAALRQLYDAIDATRIRGQIQYTNYVLSSDGKFWSSPAKQLHVLGNLSYILVLLAFVANFAALVYAVWRSDAAELPFLSSFGIACAIIAVGARAMLEGLRPQRETRRMQFYAAAVSHAGDTFVKARTHNKRIEALSRFERASYDEMIEFISTNEHARFVL